MKIFISQPFGIFARIFTLFITLTPAAHAIDFTLFGDIVYSSYSSDSDDTDADTFTLGQFDLIADQEIGENTAVTAEVVFEDGGDGFEVDVERFSITKSLQSGISVALGRFHTPIGFWNHNFHHGSLIQDTINRPFFIEFEDDEGGILPNHIIGILGSGVFDEWGFSIALANGNGINTNNAANSPENATLEVLNTQDVNDDKSLVARINYVSNTTNSEFGLFAMLNKVSETGRDTTALLNYGDTLFEQSIYGFDFRYNTKKFYIMSEYFLLNIEDNENIPTSANITPNDESYDINAYYLQLGLHINHELTLALRREYLDYDESGAYLDLLGIDKSTSNTVLAINYKLEESNSLRFEVDNRSSDNSDDVLRYSVQWFFLLF